MNSRIKKINAQQNEIANFNSLTVMGDPGCDGLGASIMSVFAKALTEEKADASVIVGDIVHRGIKPLYKTVVNFVNIVSENDVYTLCGNHDTAFYEEYFGLRNYALYNDKTLLIFLDDSKRTFEEQTISFLDKTLKDFRRKNIVLFFHIPPPNDVSANSVSKDEWEKIMNVLRDYKENVKYIICGHVHSYYEDKIEGIKLIVTGGAGAQIEYVSEKVDTKKARHHIVRLYYENEKLLYKYIPLKSSNYKTEVADIALKSYLEKSLANEAIAHIRYKLFSEEAKNSGFTGIAKLFEALSDSEFYHAKNYFYVLNKMNGLEENLNVSEEGESFEINEMYNNYLDYSNKNEYGLAAYSFYDSLEAEKVHHKALSEAIESYSKGNDIKEKFYHTCTSCGFTFIGVKTPVNCPVCGAPNDKIKEIS